MKEENLLQDYDSHEGMGAAFYGMLIIACVVVVGVILLCCAI